MQDLEDTTGSWELYGQEDEKRYPSMQAEFFNRAAAPLTRRESILAFTFVGEPSCYCIIGWETCLSAIFKSYASCMQCHMLRNLVRASEQHHVRTQQIGHGDMCKRET